MIHNYLIGSGILYKEKTSAAKNHSAMPTPNEIEELRLLIRDELNDCIHQHWPNVCDMRSTPKGLAKLEEMILRAIADDGLDIGSAIALIEQELAHSNW